LVGEDRFDLLADVEASAADLAGWDDVAACPVFDGGDGCVQHDGDLFGGHDVLGGQPARHLD